MNKGKPLKPIEYLYKPGVMDKHKVGKASRRFEDLVEEFEKGKIRLDPSSRDLLELAFFTAAVVRGVTNSQLRRVYSEIISIRDEARKVERSGGKGDWSDVLTALNKARIMLAYSMARAKNRDEFENLYRVLDEALRRATSIVESEKTGREDKKRAIEALHFLAQGIIAFHRFLGGRQ
ncbi:type III-A CRISPR-associated protein Csm2 [Methanopyrus sp.]